MNQSFTGGTMKRLLYVNNMYKRQWYLSFTVPRRKGITTATDKPTNWDKIMLVRGATNCYNYSTEVSFAEQTKNKRIDRISRPYSVQCTCQTFRSIAFPVPILCSAPIRPSKPVLIKLPNPFHVTALHPWSTHNLRMIKIRWGRGRTVRRGRTLGGRGQMH